MRTGRYYLPRDLVGIVGDQVAQIRARRWAELHAETEKILLSSHRRVSVMSITNLGVYAAAVLVAALLCNPVEAQQQQRQQPQTVTLSSLISKDSKLKQHPTPPAVPLRCFSRKAKTFSPAWCSYLWRLGLDIGSRGVVLWTDWTRALNLCRAHAVIESGNAIGKLVLTGFSPLRPYWKGQRDQLDEVERITICKTAEVVVHSLSCLRRRIAPDEQQITAAPNSCAACPSF